MRFASALLGTVCGLLSCLLGLAWLDNFYLSWIKRIWMMEEDVALQITGLFPELFPTLDLFSIDHSTVSTFIPFWGLALVTRGFYTINRCTISRRRMNLNKEFPFFPGYNEWMVSLGLMGTVWGLIMIGYLPDLENLKIPGLLGALRTALFSTLVSLVWVYIIVLRIIRPGMQWFAEKCLGQPVSSVSSVSLQTAVEKFAENLEALNSVLADSTQIMSEFRKKVTVKNLDSAEKFFTTCTENLPKIEETCKQQIGKLEEVRILLEGHLTVSHQHSNYLDTIRKSQAEHGHGLMAIKKKLDQKYARDAINRKRIGKIIDIFKGYSEE